MSWSVQSKIIRECKIAGRDHGGIATIATGRDPEYYTQASKGPAAGA
jgi:hypothetical protein